MKAKAKTALLVLVVAFLIYAVVTNPQKSADYVQTIFSFISDVFKSIFSFFDALLH